MALNPKCILFNGGKTIELSNISEGDKSGLKLTKNGDGSWQLNINAIISNDEAKKVIFNYTELRAKVEKDEQFETEFPNMPYFEALDDNGDAKFVPLAARSQITPTYNRDLGGTITIKLNIGNFGKTQNPKTQNAGGI